MSEGDNNFAGFPMSSAKQTQTDELEKIFNHFSEANHPEGELKRRLKSLVESSAEIDLQYAVTDKKITEVQAKAFDMKIQIKNAYLDRILDEAAKEIFADIYTKNDTEALLILTTRVKKWLDK